MNVKKLFGFSILILLMLVPTVLAGPKTQAFDSAIGFLGAFRWFVVNAILLFAIYTIIQMYLFKDKQGKEKIILWIVAALLILGIAWFSSRGRYIWEFPFIGLIFNLKILVNTVIIGAAIHTALPWFGIKHESIPGKSGSYIITGIFSFMISAGLGNVWIWERESIRAIVGYLLGPGGLLTINPNASPPNYNLFVFITMAALLSWIFIHFKVAESNKKISYALSILIAASITRGGTTLLTAVKFVQVTLILILGNALSKSWTANKWYTKISAYLLIGTLVEWAVYSVAPEYSLLAILGGVAIGGLKFLLYTIGIGIFIGVGIAIYRLVMRLIP